MVAERPARRTHTATELAKKLDCDPRTIRRYMAIPRKQYLANALTQSKPWEALGMSRATWYRKGKPKSIPWRWKKRRLAIVVTP